MAITSTLPDTHRCWIWQGGDTPAALQLHTQPLPLPADGFVLVQNHAIGLNPVDWKTLSMKSASVPGVDGAGIVVQVGGSVDPAWLGKRVAYHHSLTLPGSYAEYTAVASRALIAMPDSMDFATAASLPCPLMTAWQAIQKLPATPGQRLLISGAGGSVGHYLVQLAVRRGWEVSTMSHPRHWPHLTQLGATHCLSNQQTESNTTVQATPRYHAIIDSTGPDQALSLCPLLKANGHIVAIQGRIEHWPNPAFGRAVSMHEVALGALHQFGDNDDWLALTQAAATLLHDIAHNTLQTEPLLKIGFADIPTRLTALKQRNFSGKLVAIL